MALSELRLQDRLLRLVAVSDPLDSWLPALLDRHRRALSTSEFLKAVRALSARYVERRSELGQRSPTDSAGKRAAFSGFFAPLHFLTVREAVRALGAETIGVDQIVDFGCGTGVGAAAWALECPVPAAISGVDRETWALDEARWNWQQLGLVGRARRHDLVAATTELLASPRRRRRSEALLFAWSLNEIGKDHRGQLLGRLLEAAAAGTPILIIEPLSRRATPWWPEWASKWHEAGGRADEWKFAADLPPALDEISRAAGFQREALGARTLWIARRDGAA